MNKNSSYLIIVMIILINILWYLVFNLDLFNFWLRILAAITILNLIVFKYKNYNIRFSLSDIKVGITSALLLYLIFYFAKFGSELLFSWSHQQIMSVYLLKTELDYRLIILVLLIVGIGEELFWRGFLQQELSKKIGNKLGYISMSLVYGLVHIWTGNLILVLAALTAGLFWGYLFLRKKSINVVIISHIVWDLLIFIILPLDF